MAPLAMGEDRAALNVEGREEGRRPMAGMVVGEPLHVSQAHRQVGLGALQCLDLTFLVDAQDQGVIERIQVKAHDVADLLYEESIGRQFETARPVRLHTEQGKVAMHRALADARLLGDAAHAPVGCVLRPGAQDGPQQPRDFLVIVSAWARARSGRLSSSHVPS